MKTSTAMVGDHEARGHRRALRVPRNQLLEAAAIADIRTIIVRQERVGLHMADAVSRLTRGKKIGAFCMQHGPGAENAYGGVAQAYGDSVPVLVLPAGYARKNAYLPFNYNSTREMAGMSKHAEPVIIGAEVPNILRRAFSHAAQWPAAAGGRRDSVRRVRRRGAGTAELHARHRRALGAGPGSGHAGGEGADQREAAGHLCGPGLSLRRGLQGTAGARRAARDSRVHELAGQELVR